MTYSLRHVPLYLAAFLLACIGLLSMAPAVNANPAEDMAALKKFTLTEDTLHHWMEAREEASRKGVSLQMITPSQMRSNKGGMPSLQAMIDHVDHQPGASDLLARHDMTSRQYVLASMALMLGSLNALAGAEGDTLNQDNVDFIRAHQKEIEAYLKNRGAK